MEQIFKTDFCKIVKFRCTCGRTYINTSNCKQCTSGNEKQTRADRMRQMTDEELAIFIMSLKNTFGEEYEGEMSFLDWLQSEEK